MPPRNLRNTQRRSRLPGLLLGGAGLITLLTVGVIGTLWIAGVPLNPFAEEPENPYVVRIPINAAPVPAYTKVQRDHLLGPDRDLAYQRVPPPATVGMSIVGIDESNSHVESRVESVKNVDDEVVFVVEGGAEVRQANTMKLGGAIMQVSSIIGRVVKKDKRVGLGFTEKSFFPRGTPEGIAGATPSGMRAFTLDATRLTGVHALNAGDEIDLIASMPTPAEGAELTEDGGGGVKLLAQQATVLRPVYVRNEITSNASLLNGARTRNIPKYEVAIAVATRDVIPLQNAINQQLSITCVAHSMKPVDEGEEGLVADNMDEVRVPVTVRPILAYQVVSRDAFVNVATRTLRTTTLPKQQADRMGVITSINDALGAITRQDIPAGRYLRRSDLLKGPAVSEPAESAEPSGARSFEVRNRTNRVAAQTVQFTQVQQQQEAPRAPAATAVGDRPALTRFIPPGRTAFAIPLNRIYGGEHLQIGDSIDLLAGYSLEDDGEETETRPDGTVIERKLITLRDTERSWEETFGNRGEPWFVASGAVVVAPVGFPAPAPALRAIAAAGPNRQRQNRRAQLDGPAVVIAVESRDVEPVAAALATRDALFTVAFHAEQSASAPEGAKTIALAPVPIGAYSKLSETAWVGNRREVATRIIQPTDPRFDEALTPQQLIGYYGRVLRADKARGDYFTADDFLPEGTREGLAAAAREGFTLFPVANNEIEGLDSFAKGDHLTILLRAVVETRFTERVSPNGVATSTVIAERVSVARGSVGGQSVLEVRNSDLTRLQAIIARSLTDRGDDGRSHLIAVGVPRDQFLPDRVAGIPPFTPLADFKAVELLIGGRRRVEFYAGDLGAGQDQRLEDESRIRLIGSQSL